MEFSMRIDKTAILNALKEYFILFIGVFSSLIVTLINNYIFKINQPYPDSEYEINIDTFSVFIVYVTASGYFINIVTPILGIFLKKIYENVFKIFIFINGSWVVVFIIADMTDLFLTVFSVGLPLHVAYFIALRENEKCWKE
jgi:hypothetical protein